MLLFGEAFSYAELDELTNLWKNVVIQNPDYVLVNQNITDNEINYFLRPDENLRRIILSKNAKDQEDCKNIKEDVIDAVKSVTILS